MTDTTYDQLERWVRQVPGVLGAHVLPTAHGVEIQALILAGSAAETTRARVAELARTHLHDDVDLAVDLLEVDASGETRAEPPEVPGAIRPALERVVLATREGVATAEVTLRAGTREVTGRSVEPVTQQAIGTVARAAGAAFGELATAPDDLGTFEMEHVGLADTPDGKAVLVTVRWLRGGEITVGACPVGDAPFHDTAAKAALDALNRRLSPHVTPEVVEEP